MRTQPPIDAGESQVGMPCSRSAVLHQHLIAAASDERARLDLYASLLMGSVYVESMEILLGEQGPEVEFSTTATKYGPAVIAYSSRTRHRGAHRSDLESTAFAYLLHALPEGVGIVLDPNHECYLIEPEEVRMLRQCAPIQTH